MPNTFSKPLQDASEIELLHWTNTLAPDFAKLTSDELSRRNLMCLNKTIENAIVQNQKSAEVEKSFTVSIFFLTVVQALIAVSQFILSFAYSDSIQVKIFGIIMCVVTIAVSSFVGTKVLSSTR